jgi:DNA-binding CsgD family transcriptional regulator
MVMTPRERYQTDPQFHALVEYILHFLYEARFSPTELREAAMLAAIIYDQQNPAPPMLMKQEEDILRWLNRGKT